MIDKDTWTKINSSIFSLIYIIYYINKSYDLSEYWNNKLLN